MGSYEANVSRLAPALAAFALACSSSGGSSPAAVGGAAGDGGSAGLGAGGSSGGGTSGTGGSAGTGDGGDAGAPIANELTDPARWSQTTVGSTGTFDSEIAGAFDGRYVYFVQREPSSGYYAYQYDTKLPLEDAAAWSVFDTGLLPGPGGYASATVAGGRLYLGGTNQVAIFDPAKPFSDVLSWQVLDLGIDSSLIATGSASDGAHAFFTLPSSGDSYVDEIDGASSTWFNVADGVIFDQVVAAAYDGKHVYFAPYLVEGARYDVTKDVQVADSYEAFDTQTVLGPDATTFQSAACDGEHVYFVGAEAVDSATLVRYTTSAALDAPTSWELADLRSVLGVPYLLLGRPSFDGKYLYLITNPTQGSDGPVLVRHDTSRPLNDASSWTQVSQSFFGMPPGPKWQFRSVVFDGRYLYFAVGTPGIDVRRFDTGSTLDPLPPCMASGAFN
jgi:hypothetical protein